jgi:carbamoyl-phosphate synthase small subunit
VLQGAEPKALGEAEFGILHQLLKPQPGESRWMEVDWYPIIWEARQQAAAAGKPIFGICLGHQMLALALGGRTVKMNHGHHGANHPVKDLETGKVEITSMNHGFAVDGASLPEGVIETHVSLFDGSNCGIRVEGRPVFSVQYHPEASPGPQDSAYLFERFTAAMA